MLHYRTLSYALLLGWLSVTEVLADDVNSWQANIYRASDEDLATTAKKIRVELTTTALPARFPKLREEIESALDDSEKLALLIPQLKGGTDPKNIADLAILRESLRQHLNHITSRSAEPRAYREHLEILALAESDFRNIAPYRGSIAESLEWLERHDQARPLIRWHQKYRQFPNVVLSLPSPFLRRILRLKKTFAVPFTEQMFGAKIFGSGQADIQLQGQTSIDSERAGFLIRASGPALISAALHKDIGKNWLRTTIDVDAVSSIQMSIPVAISRDLRFSWQEPSTQVTTKASIRDAHVLSRREHPVASRLVKRLAQKEIKWVENLANQKAKKEIRNQVVPILQSIERDINRFADDVVKDSFTAADLRPQFVFSSDASQLLLKSTLVGPYQSAALSPHACPSTPERILFCVHESYLNHLAALLDGQNIDGDDLRAKIFADVLPSNDATSAEKLSRLKFADKNALRFTISPNTVMLSMNLEEIETENQTLQGSILAQARFRFFVDPIEGLMIQRDGEVVIELPGGDPASIERLRHIATKALFPDPKAVKLGFNLKFLADMTPVPLYLTNLLALGDGWLESSISFGIDSQE